MHHHHQLKFNTFVFLYLAQKPSVVWQILCKCGILPINVGIWVIIQLDQLRQWRHTGIVVQQHCWQVRGFAFDAAGATNRSQKLEIFDVALFPGHTCTCLSFNSLFDTEEKVYIYKKKKQDLRKSWVIYFFWKSILKFQLSSVRQCY